MKPIQYPSPPSVLQEKKWWKAIGFLGPGIIIASVSIGNGETVFASRGGAIFGYAILWCFFLGIFLKGTQIYASARYMLLSGEHPMQRGQKGFLVRKKVQIVRDLLTFMQDHGPEYHEGGGKNEYG